MADDFVLQSSRQDSKHRDPGGGAPIDLPDLDPVLHAPARLAIATVLAFDEHAPVAFSQLQERLGLTAGNLSTHLRRLEDAGYVAVDKVFRDRVPSTEVTLTDRGHDARSRYARTLTAYLDGSVLTERSDQRPDQPPDQEEPR